MAGISPININVNQALVNGANTNAPQVTGIEKSTRVAGQSQDNLVNIATTSTQNSSENQQYAHQRHVALQGYLSLTPGSQENKGQEQDTVSTKDSQEPTTKQTPKGLDGQELTQEEQETVKQMKARDEEVRVHENAHKSAGGQYAGSPSYTYETGPDGRRYITEGEVSIDISDEDDPSATIEKMQVVKRAAMAPAEPSGQDRKVYQQAAQKEATARQELAEEKKKEAQEQKEKTNNAINGDSKAVNPKDSAKDTKGNKQLIEDSDNIKVPKSASGPISLDTGF